MDKRTIMRNLKEHFFFLFEILVHDRFIQREIWCKILKLASSEVHVHKK